MRQRWVDLLLSELHLTTPQSRELAASYLNALLSNYPATPFPGQVDLPEGTVTSRSRLLWLLSQAAPQCMDTLDRSATERGVNALLLVLSEEGRLGTVKV